MVRARAQLKLDVRSQKAQGIYHNTSNSLTGASASSAGAIHYATTLPASTPMVRPRAHVSHRKTGGSKYAPGVFKAHLRSVAFGRTKGKAKGGRKSGRRSAKKHHVRHHKHKAGTEKRKGAAYCTRPYKK
ncbi:TPA: hypothetical protein ACH3X1_009806 [Trebouxia sp. C0004]